MIERFLTFLANLCMERCKVCKKEKGRTLKLSTVPVNESNHSDTLRPPIVKVTQPSDLYVLPFRIMGSLNSSLRKDDSRWAISIRRRA
jgi:hypothetical protein